jgi:hypothetical protein
MSSCIRITFCSFLVNPMARVKTIVLLGVDVGHDSWLRRAGRVLWKVSTSKVITPVYIN